MIPPERKFAWYGVVFGTRGGPKTTPPGLIRMVRRDFGVSRNGKNDASGTLIRMVRCDFGVYVTTVCRDGLGWDGWANVMFEEFY